MMIKTSIEKLAEEIGFEYMTGTLWKHERIGIISISKNDKPIDLVQKIYDRGFGECQVVIKSSLGIKS